MAGQLDGCVLGFLWANGVRRASADGIRARLHAMGARVHHIGLRPGDIHADDGTQIACDAAVSEVSPGYYDGLLMLDDVSTEEIEGEDDESIALLQLCAERRLPLGALGNGVALLADAGVIAGCRIACNPELREGVRSAEGRPSDDAVAADRFIVTGRTGCDLDELCEAFARVVRSRWQEVVDVDERSRESFPASDAHSGSTAG